MVAVCVDRPWYDVRRRAASYAAYDLYHLNGRHELTAGAEQQLATDLAGILPELQIRMLFEIKPGLLCDTDHLIVAVDQSRRQPIGVLASRWCRTDPDRFLHVVMQLVAPAFQRTHLTKRMWGVHFARLCQAGQLPSLIALRTYNPSVFVSMRAFTRIPGVELYPRIDAGEQDADMLALARRVSACLNPGHQLCPDVGVLKSAGVPRTFYPRIPRCSRADVAGYFARHLEEGDRVLCLLRISTETAIARMLRAFGCNASKERRHDEHFDTPGSVSAVRGRDGMRLLAGDEPCAEGSVPDRGGGRLRRGPDRGL